MARKHKREKFKSRNQFRYSKSKKAGYHPHYIFGEDNKNYYSLGLTTHPKNRNKVFKIKSPNPKYNGPQYIQKKPFKMKKNAYKNKRLKGWFFDKNDLPVIRHIKKSYKKRK